MADGTGAGEEKGEVAPDPVTPPKVVVQGAHTLAVLWSVVPGAQGYILEFSEVPDPESDVIPLTRYPWEEADGGDVLVAGKSVSKVIKVLTSLSAGATYVVRVRTWLQVGDDDEAVSNPGPVSERVRLPDTTKLPASPEAPTADVIANKSLTLTWRNSDRAARYKVQVKNASSWFGADFEDKATVMNSGDKLFHATVNDLLPSYRYSVRLVAVNDEGRESAPSDALDVTMLTNEEEVERLREHLSDGGKVGALRGVAKLHAGIAAFKAAADNPEDEEIKKLRLAKTQLEMKLSEAQGRAKTLETELEAAKSEISEGKAGFSKLRESHASIGGKLTDMERSLQSAKQALEEQRKTLSDAFAQEKSALEQELERERTRAADAVGAKEIVDGKMESLEGELQELQANFAEARAAIEEADRQEREAEFSHNQEVTALREEVAETMSALKTAMSACEHLKEQVSTAESAKGAARELSEELADKQSALADLQSQLDSAIQDRDRAVAQLGTAASDAAKREEDLASQVTACKEAVKNAADELLAAREAATSKTASMSQQLAAKELAIDELQRELEAAHKDRDSAAAQVRASATEESARTDELSEQLAATAKSLETVEHDLQVARDATSRHEETIRSLSAELSTAKEAAARSERALREAHESGEAQQAEARKLREQATAAAADELAKAKGETNELWAQLRDANASIDRKESELDVATKSLHDEREAAAELRDVVEGLQRKMSEMEQSADVASDESGKLEEANGTISRLQGSVEALQERVSSLERSLATAAQAVTKATAEAESSRAGVVELEIKASEVSAEADALRSQVEELQHHVAQVEDRERQLRAQFSDSDSKAAERLEGATRLQEQCDALEKQLQFANDTNSLLKTEINNVKTESMRTLGSVQAENTGLQEEIAGLHRQVAEAISNKDALSDELQQLRRTHTDHLEVSRLMNEERKELARRLAELEGRSRSTSGAGGTGAGGDSKAAAEEDDETRAFLSSKLAGANEERIDELMRTSVANLKQMGFAIADIREAVAKYPDASQQDQQMDYIVSRGSGEATG